ncbi:MAG: hypothetical protein FJ100_13160 [Deltaproteobacteria bacterium]|nr:hypothetical protein [Deltaproteobacteria bacterium]
MRALCLLVAVVLGCGDPAPKTGTAAVALDAAPQDSAQAAASDAIAAEAANALAPSKKPCSLAAECPPPTLLCAVASCTLGWCSVEPAPNGQPCGASDCGPLTCISGACTAPNPFAETVWSPGFAVTARALCEGWDTPWLAGNAMLPNGEQRAWIGRAGESVLWNAGAVADLLACRSDAKRAVGLRRTTFAAESDAMLLKLGDKGEVADASFLKLAGDDAWTAMADTWGSSWLAGTRDGGENGIDAMWAPAKGDSQQPYHLAAPGDQYVTGAVSMGDDSAVLCGYQSMAGAPADGWFAQVDAGDAAIWQVTVGGPGVQRIHGCVQGAAGQVVGAGTTLVDVGQGPTARLWLVAIDAETGATHWQRNVAWPGGEGAELTSLAQGKSGGYFATGFVRSLGVERPIVARFNAQGWAEALAVRGQELGRGVGVRQDWNDKVLVGLAWSAPHAAAAIARVSENGNTDCSCLSAKNFCPSTPGCRLASCAAQSSQCAWAKPLVLQGAACPLDNGTLGLCGSDGCSPQP